VDNKSTETANHWFIRSVQEAWDRHIHVVSIFLDLSKAYDVINHNKLLHKLDCYGVRGSSNMWFKSYLTNRTQFVEISRSDRTRRRYQSSPRVIAHEVPHGSILGPLLCLVYINDLPLNIHMAKLVLCADDTNILVVDENTETLQARLSLVTKQLDVWFPKKTLS
jgi:hypothetical protein